MTTAAADHTHSAAEYRRGRRDAGCRAAHNEETARYRRRETDRVSTAQRKQVAALLAAGKDPVAVADATGLTWQLIHQLGTVDERVHRALNDLGPNDPVDLVQVPRPTSATYRRPVAFDTERQDKVLAGLREGLTPHSAARRAGVSPNTVARHLAAGGAFAAAAAAVAVAVALGAATVEE